jgi:hypothetical protein
LHEFFNWVRQQSRGDVYPHAGFVEKAVSQRKENGFGATPVL